MKKNKSFQSGVFSSQKRGFSLIELLVVVAIIIIMTGALVASQNDNKSQKDVETAAQQMIAQLRLLQNEALSGKKVGTVLTTACYFNFTIDPADLFAYRIGYSDCSGNPIAGSITTHNFNSKRTIKASVNTGFYFDTPFGKVTSTFPLPIQIKLSRGTGSDSVCICASGNIFEQKDIASPCGC